MTLAEALRTAREKYLRGEHRLLGLLDETALVMDAAGHDVELACAALDLLDRTAGGDGEFSRFVDGGEAVVDGDSAGFAYRYDRSPHEVSAIIGKAAMLASRLEEDAP